MSTVFAFQVLLKWQRWTHPGKETSACPFFIWLANPCRIPSSLCLCLTVSSTYPTSESQRIHLPWLQTVSAGAHLLSWCRALNASMAQQKQLELYLTQLASKNCSDVSHIPFVAPWRITVWDWSFFFLSFSALFCLGFWFVWGILVVVLFWGLAGFFGGWGFFFCLFYLWFVLFGFGPKHRDCFIDLSDMRCYFMQIEVVLEKGAGDACNELLGVNLRGFPVCTGQSVVWLIFTRTAGLTFLLYSCDRGSEKASGCCHTFSTFLLEK